MCDNRRTREIRDSVYKILRDDKLKGFAWAIDSNFGVTTEVTLSNESVLSAESWNGKITPIKPLYCAYEDKIQVFRFENPVPRSIQFGVTSGSEITQVSAVLPNVHTESCGQKVILSFYHTEINKEGEETKVVGEDLTGALLLDQKQSYLGLVSVESKLIIGDSIVKLHREATRFISPIVPIDNQSEKALV